MKALMYFTTILMALSMWSCRSIKYVPVESVRYDSIYFNKIVKDSVYVKDSVLIVKGDTITEYRCKYIYKYKDRIDTLYVTQTDSVQVPYPVEKQLTKWQQFKVEVGGWAVTIVVITILIVFGRFVYKLKK